MNRRCFLELYLSIVVGFSFEDSITNAQNLLNRIQPKRIYLALDDHTDYLWSEHSRSYENAFLDMIDYYINSADKTTETELPQYQNRFSCDGSLWMRVYEKNRSPEQFRRLIDRIESGHITVPLTVLTLCYGAMPAEAVIRSMYYAGIIERRYNIRFPLAQPMENQTMPFGVSSLWAGAGAKYCWMGICGCASRTPYEGKRLHDIYWWTGLDGSRLLIKWNSFSGDNRSLGGYAEARKPDEAINFVDTNDTFKKNYPYNVIGIFGKGWDDLTTMTENFIEVAKRETREDRQIIVSNEIDFFEDFEATYGDMLPSFAASFGNEWDLYSASMSELSARVKRSVEKLRCAEALATLVSLQNPEFMRSRKAAEEQAFIDMGLYWNHDWTADGKIVNRDEYANWAREIIENIELYVNSLHNDSLNMLGRMIQKEGSIKRFFVFNPLGWRRTDIVEIDIESKSPVHVVDISTNKETLSQVVFVKDKHLIQFLARDIPPVGYKVYEIRPGKATIGSKLALIDSNTIENQFYRLKVSESGAITSLIDKKHGNRELVKNIGGRTVNDLGTGSGIIEIENDGPVSTTVKVLSTSPLKHTTRITLYHHIDRISCENEITENFSSEGDFPPYWAFSFNISSPDIWHEEVGAVIRAKLLSDGGHYSPIHARYDWLTLNHFADISDNGEYGVIISNADCCFMKTGKSGIAFLDTETPQINVLVGGQIDGPKLGIPSQGGDSLFLQRFALKTHTKFSKAEAMRFSMEHQNRLVFGAVTGDKGYPPNQISLLKLSDPDLLLWAFKPHQDINEQNVVVTRFWNMNDYQSNCVISVPNYEIQSANELTHIETPVGDISVEYGAFIASLAPQQLKSFSMKVTFNYSDK
ncbi:glycoside hydrolase [Candidatus Latescibacterota bacterium]